MFRRPPGKAKTFERETLTYDGQRRWAVVIKLTDQCVAECAHCSISSAPGRNQHLSWRLTEKVVRSCSEIGYSTIWVSGGEPFLRFKDLRRLLILARTFSLHVVINSNAYWGVSLEVARRVLGKLLECGSFELAFSSDDFHLPFVSFDRVEAAVQAAKTLGVNCWLGRVTYSRDKSREEMFQRAAKLGLAVTEQPLQLTGRARQKLAYIHTTDLPSVDRCSIAMLPTVMTDGRVSMCCTGAAWENQRLIIGDLNQTSFTAIVRKMEVDLVQNILRVGGPKLLLELVSRKNQGSAAPSYLSKCQFCREVCRIPNLENRLDSYGSRNLLVRLVSIDVLQRGSVQASRR